MWLRFEEHAWQSERQIRAAQRAEQRNLREQAKRSIREEIMDVNTSLNNLSSMLFDEFGEVQGPSRAVRGGSKYKLEDDNVTVPLVEPLPPFVPAGPSKVRLKAADIKNPRRRRKGMGVDGADKTDHSILANQEGQRSSEGSPTTMTKAATTSTLHALTGSPPKRGGPRMVPAPLAPIPGGEAEATTQDGAAGVDDWWKTRASPMRAAILPQVLLLAINAARC